MVCEGMIFQHAFDDVQLLNGRTLELYTIFVKQVEPSLGEQSSKRQ